MIDRPFALLSLLSGFCSTVCHSAFQSQSPHYPNPTHLVSALPPCPFCSVYSPVAIIAAHYTNCFYSSLPVGPWRFNVFSFAHVGWLFGWCVLFFCWTFPLDFCPGLSSCSSFLVFLPWEDLSPCFYRPGLLSVLES